MGSCGKCDEALPPENDFVICSLCKGKLHYHCSSVRETTWRKYSVEIKSTWKCGQCRTKSSDDNVSTTPLKQPLLPADGVIVNGFPCDFYDTVKSFIKNAVRDENEELKMALNNFRVDIDRQLCSRRDEELAAAEREIVLLNKYIGSLESRIADQAMIIGLLNNKVKKTNVGGDNDRVRGEFERRSASTKDKNDSDSDHLTLPVTDKAQDGCLIISRSHDIGEQTSQLLNNRLTDQDKPKIETNRQGVSEKEHDASGLLDDVVRVEGCEGIHEINPTGWNTVVRKRPRRPAVIGSNRSEKGQLLRGAPKYSSLHVCRLDPKTTVRDVADSLKPICPEVACEALASRHPDQYASFKVTILQEHLQLAMKPEIWPFGCRVRPFFQPRRPTSPKT